MDKKKVEFLFSTSFFFFFLIRVIFLCTLKNEFFFFFLQVYYAPEKLPFAKYARTPVIYINMFEIYGHIFM